MPSYEDDLSKFEEYDTQVLGISVDSIPSHEAWQKSIGGITYPLVSDFYPHGAIAEKFGVLRKEAGAPAYGAAERALFIIDKEGVVQFIDVHPIGEQPDNEELYEVLRKL
ncbi:alkyl hydroperoxide reductase subunit AhpC [Ammoniphilus resinae]|nr:alkyl hydroperoxide reductase subunit AhpC [Ammoniphilus resinae]